MNKLDLSNPEDRIFGSILKRQAEEAGDTPFLVCDDLSVTFAQAEDITNRLATGLEALGVGPGDRVAMYMGNRPEAVLIALAVNKLSAIWTPICTDYKGAWLADTISRCRCKVLVTDSELLPRLTEDCQALLAQVPLVLLENGDSKGDQVAATYAELAA
ncbi:MAG: AMP-binding protein, partial [Halioglobus sp.]